MAYRITVVEDNEPDLFLLKESLKEAEVACAITSFADGLDARIHFESIAAAADAPDLIVLDLNLPKVSGEELLKLIRDRAELAHVPVVIWSSARSECEMHQLDRWNIARFITKPNNYTGFLAIGSELREILNVAACP